MGPDINYVLIEDLHSKGVSLDYYIVAAERLAAYFTEAEDYKIVGNIKGTQLLGVQYEPLFPYFKDAASQNAFRVYAGDFVSTADGTGIVHTAPGFGEDDQRVLKGTGIPIICPVDAECRFTDEVSDYKGIFFKDADKPIIERLKNERKLIRR